MPSIRLRLHKYLGFAPHSRIRSGPKMKIDKHGSRHHLHQICSKTISPPIPQRLSQPCTAPLPTSFASAVGSSIYFVILIFSLWPVHILVYSCQVLRTDQKKFSSSSISGNVNPCEGCHSYFILNHLPSCLYWVLKTLLSSTFGIRIWPSEEPGVLCLSLYDNNSPQRSYAIASSYQSQAYDRLVYFATSG